MNTKRLFIIHGWGGSPEEPLIRWLGEEGRKLGFETVVPEMPNSATPTIDAWVNHIESVVAYPDENTYFIGHSIGCQAIYRYLQSPEIVTAGGAICIAPWLVLTGLETPEDQDIARPWLDNPLDLGHVKKVLKSSVAIFSDNDPDVPMEENKTLFQAKLDPVILIEHAKGHFTEADGVTELPSTIAELKRIASLSN